MSPLMESIDLRVPHLLLRRKQVLVRVHLNSKALVFIKTDHPALAGSWSCSRVSLEQETSDGQCVCCKHINAGVTPPVML
ncbi:hypothetical protein MHYP_G00354040 [Metynnis hypsauchen]